MDFSKVTDWTIPEGSVDEVRETDTGRVIWSRMISVTYHDHMPYVLTYDPNFTTTQPLSTGVFYSEEPYPIRPCSYVRDGYAFRNWNDRPDGTGTTYFINDELVRSGDYRIYAQWESGILMVYRDSDGTEKIHRFQRSELPDPFRITDYLSPYPLVEPFNTILSGDKSRLLEFIDTDGEITEIGDFGIYSCTNVRNVYMPGVVTGGVYCYASNNKLKNLTITNMNGVDNATFNNTDLTYCRIDSADRKSFANTDKGEDVYEDQIIGAKGEHIVRPLAVVKNCSSIDRDDITAVGSYVLSKAPILKTVCLPNLTAIYSGSQVFNMTTESIYVDNSTLQSKSTRQGYPNNYVVGNNGTRLVKILPRVTAFEDNSITSFQSNWCECITNLRTVRINNDTVQSVANDTALLSKDGKTLIRVLPNTEFTPEKYPEEYSQLTALYVDCFAGCNTIGSVELPNVVSVTNGSSNLTYNSKVKRLALDNLTLQSGQVFTFGDGIANCEYVSFAKLTAVQGGMFYRSSTNINEKELVVNMPNATSIGSRAFRQNCQVRNLAFDNATTVGAKAFERCMNLQTVSLNACTSFGDDSFRDCVYIDGSVRKTHLTDVYCGKVTKSWIQSNKDRIGFPAGCTCHCSDGDYTIT